MLMLFFAAMLARARQRCLLPLTPCQLPFYAAAIV